MKFFVWAFKDLQPITFIKPDTNYMYIVHRCVSLCSIILRKKHCFRLFCNFLGYIYTMTDRMNNYKTLYAKVNNKINTMEHLTLYNSSDLCVNSFLCGSIQSLNATWKTDLVLDRISFLIDLVIVEAIDQGKQENALELVLKVKYLTTIISGFNFKLLF